jgi:peptide/nickel transport system ATP-binding protein/oligopeptide transport system ATP-binding protein
MQKGKVIEQGSVENIYNAPQQIYTQQLLSAIPGQGLRAATA